MDHSAPEERDLESGGTGSEDELSSGTHLGNKSAEHMLGRLRTEFFGYDGHVNGEASSSTYKSGTSCEDSPDSIELLIDKYPEPSIERIPPLEKKRMREKRKNSFRKASKPPRPPKGPTLDVLDMKFVMEVSELAKKKRARIRRIKALRKMKSETASLTSSSSLSSSGSLAAMVVTSLSSSGSLAAMVVTLIFFVVLLFQGLSRHGSSLSFGGSPEPATAAHRFISVRFFNSTSLTGGPAPSSIFP